MGLIEIILNRTIERNHGQNQTFTRCNAAIFLDVEAGHFQLHASFLEVGPLNAIRLVAKEALLDQGPHPALITLAVVFARHPLRNDSQVNYLTKGHSPKLLRMFLNGLGR